MAEGYNDRLTQGVWRGTCGKPEVEDTMEVVAEKAATLATWIRSCKRLVVHTGAGISTSAGIRDFRGPNGVWTEELERAKKQKTGKRSSSLMDGRPAVSKRRKVKEEPAAPIGKAAEGAVGSRPKDPPMAEASPTFSHMALAALLDYKLAHIVTQNVDCLHRRSGVPAERLSELHGNICMEVCEDCGTEYIRSFEIETLSRRPTGRHCDGCNGALRDCLLDWNDELDSSIFEKAQKECEMADLHLCIGTSMQMSPAAQLPFASKKAHRAARLKLNKKKKRKHDNAAKDELSDATATYWQGDEEPPRVVILNLQKTSQDYRADLVVHAKSDAVMQIVVESLGLAVQLYKKE